MDLVHDDDLERILRVSGNLTLNQLVSERIGVTFASFVTFIHVPVTRTILGNTDNSKLGTIKENNKTLVMSHDDS